MYRSPTPTVDVAIIDGENIILVKRGHEPHKGSWVLPGGFIEYGETAEEAAVREVLEETGVSVRLVDILGVYSAPERDPRKHILTVVFVAERIEGEPVGGDDAAEAKWFKIKETETMDLGFDHGLILRNLREWLRSKGTFWSTRSRSTDQG
ncbi:MAG: NUDIX hydrolase [Candidatus Thorarchaeota archaeon]|nr:NUDIX hydrolase [Candidatus Thorarchaeota archaeon]